MRSATSSKLPPSAIASRISSNPSGVRASSSNASIIRVTRAAASGLSVWLDTPAVSLPEAGHHSLGNRLVAQSRAVDQLDPFHAAHPGQLAAGVGAVGGLDRLDRVGRRRAVVIFEQLLEAQGRAGGAR